MTKKDKEKKERIRLAGIKYRAEHPYDPVRRRMYYLRDEKYSPKNLCKNEFCRQRFEPYSRGQLYCSAECRRSNMKLVVIGGCKKRVCLSCNMLFFSKGPHNRRCRNCKKRDEGVYDGAGYNYKKR